MRSFAILKTNPGLTTNCKIMVDSIYNMFMESIESMPELSSSSYKKVAFNKDNFYDELIPYFYNGLSIDTAFSIKYDSDNDNMSSKFQNQYDDIYQMGARNILDNKNYTEEFECFAPLYLSKSGIPNSFVIFRVDGPGLITLTKNNFLSEIIDNLKCVKVFDLSKSTPIGEWIDKNFISNKYFPSTPFEMSFKSLEFSQWNGINYDSGGYTYKSFFLDEMLEKENTLFDLEKFVFDGYKNNKVVFPHILNLSFLFDDTPATPNSLRKWSINRYFGFYINDMESYDAVSPHLLHKLKDDITISDGNIISSPNGGSPFVDPWNDSLIYYVEYKGNFYKVQKFTLSTPVGRRRVSSSLTTDEMILSSITSYRIISDINLDGKESDLNKKIIYIDNTNHIVNVDNTYYQIDNFDSSDIWLIKINDKYHNLVNDGGKIKINTDYAFSFDLDSYSYWINNPDDSYKTKVSLKIDANNPPVNFKIFRLNLTDIKDFDTNIIDTEYSKFEYEISDDLTNTDETKMYMTDLRSSSDPKTLDDYIFNDKVINIPTSSEYTTGYETFGISGNDLTPLWRKNNIHCRWSYQDSISSNDYPYLMNNSLIFEDFNRTSNTFDPDPKRIERNLDYYYTINAGTSSYIHHTLHVENNNNGISDTNFKFEIDKYLGTFSGSTYSDDYFSYFFSRKTTFDNGSICKPVDKYSCLTIGDDTIPNTTLFRGLKFRAYDVDTIKSDGSVIENINLKNSNTFQDYKFSILLSKNDYNIDSLGITSSYNSMQWDIIENWEMDKIYASGSIVLMDDILYQSTIDSVVTNPITTILGSQVKSAPYNDPNWISFTYSYGIVNATSSMCPFWNPNTVYNKYDIVYNSGDYYVCSATSSTQSFWNPNISYSAGQTILFKGKYYTSNISGNIFPPNVSIQNYSGSTWSSNWTESSSNSPMWSLIELWNPSISYSSQYIVHNNIVYYTSSTSQIGDEPGKTSTWIRIYSLEQDTDYIYKGSSNPFISLNNKIYMIKSNSSNSTLENGINIYINKIHKNILINIFINDNTTPYLSNHNRDDMYTDLNKKLTAFNFINCISDISNKYGFSDYLSYIIIDESGFKKFNINNIYDLKYFISCESPDELIMRKNSLTYTSIVLSKSVIKVKNMLKNGKITNISELNYYNDIPMGVSIQDNKDEEKVQPIYHGISNITSNQIYRHSGYYMPLFKNIELFEKSTGNYKFDTSYTNFGITTQRVISKVNKIDNILKLKNNSSYKSIYPMIDEFGYTVVDFFIFKSTWDYEYHVECLEKPITKTVDTSPTTININK